MKQPELKPFLCPDEFQAPELHKLMLLSEIRLMGNVANPNHAVTQTNLKSVTP